MIVVGIRGGDKKHTRINSFILNTVIYYSDMLSNLCKVYNNFIITKVSPVRLLYKWCKHI